MNDSDMYKKLRGYLVTKKNHDMLRGDALSYHYLYETLPRVLPQIDGL